MLTSISGKIKQTILQHQLICPSDTVVAAVSGGSDSMAMLHVLMQLADTFPFTLKVCHVNHRLRGAESDEDAAFVARWCAAHSLPLFSTAIDIQAKKQKHESIETCARNLRYAFFSQIAESEKRGKIATAHNADDHAETVLFNLIRGTALTGLCGIPIKRDAIIRPLLYCEKKQIEQYCETQHIPFVTDRTNADTVYSRNKIRLQVLPVLKEINPALVQGLLRTTEALRQDDAYLKQIAAQSLAQAECGESAYRIAALADLEKSVLFRIFSAILLNNNISVHTEKLCQLETLITQKSGKLNLQKHWFAIVENGILSIKKIHQNYRKRT